MKIKDMALCALLAAILFVLQVALAPLPNIEVVSLLIILFTLHFRKKVVYIIYIFVLLEALMYGFGIWVFNYTYVWPILAGLTYLFRKNTSSIFWAIFSGFYGLMFGFLCAIPYLFIQGVGGFIAYCIQGIPFNIAHCAGNFFVALLLFKPLNSTFFKLKRAIHLED